MEGICPSCLERLISEGYFVDVAAILGEVDLVRSCLAAGAQLDVKGEYGVIPLHIAALQGNLECLRLLLETAKERGQLHLVEYKAYNWKTPFVVAAQYGFVDCVKLLLSYGANPNVHNANNETALHLAVESKEKEMVALLLKVMDIDILKSKCLSSSDPGPIPEMSNQIFLANPLNIAVQFSCHACLQLLLDAGFDANSVVPEFKEPGDEEEQYLVPMPDLITPLYVAFVLCDMETAQLLVKYGADVNSHISPPLNAAIVYGKHQHIDFLVNNGADLRPYDLIYVAVHEPENLFHLLHRGADARECLIHSVSALVDAVSKIRRQDEWLLAVDVLLDFLVHDVVTTNFVSAVIDRCREVFHDDHDSTEWNRILKSSAEPSSLMVLCRATLRSHLSKLRGAIFLHDALKLEIPTSLLSFVMCESLSYV